MQLTQKEMYDVTGGGTWGGIAAIGAAIAYIIGIISGYTNPSHCNN